MAGEAVGGVSNEGVNAGREVGQFVSRKLVEADGNGLTQVHGRLGFAGVDDGDGVAPGQVVGGETVFFRTEEEGDAVVWWGLFSDFGTHALGSLREGEDGLFGLAAVERSGSDDQGAVLDGGGEGVMDDGVA